MFGRRSKRRFGATLGRLIWPRSGWRRAGAYLMHRLSRIKGSPHSLAAGFASGAAVSFLPFIGLHFVLAALLALAMRASLLASAIGTVVGNPWTFPAIWISTYRLGRRLGFGGIGEAEGINFTAVLEGALKAVWDLNVPHLIHAVWPVVRPMTVGGAILGILAWLVSYLLLRPVIEAYKERRRSRLRRGQDRAQDVRTGEAPVEEVKSR